MMSVAHILTGAVATDALMSPTYLQLGAAVVGSVAPDIDHPKSVIGKIFFFISWPLAIIGGHRTITHSILGTAIFALIVLAVQSKTGLSLMMPWLVGYVSHLALDFLTKEGIQILFPYPKFFSLHLIQTGGIAELTYVVFLIFIIAFQGGNSFLP